ncbi:MAG TPA: ABC transporter permease [Acidobacteriaceae bacterium]|nr:ABC transporter permease [Acidobacteriaceae bacterium]
MFLESLLQDLRLAVRALLKSPGFALAAILTLALGIGANTAIFTVVNAVLLKPLGYPNADRMVEFGFPSSILVNFLSNVPEFHAYQRQTSVFQEVAAYDFTGPGFNLTGDRPEQVHGIHVTEGYFRLFGAPVVLGRTFTAQEDLPHGGKVAILSYGLWQRRFGGDATIVGKSISLGNEGYTIIGVLGSGFRSDPQADLWLPYQFEPVSNDMNNYFHIAGLLRPGVTLEQANAQLQLTAAQFHRDYPKTSSLQEFRVEPLRDSIVGDVRKSLLIMLGAVSLVLLIACANVANLLLVRATGRKRELAIRAALGASRTRIVRQLLSESIVLSAAGGLLGLALGFAGVRALLALSPAGLPRIGEDGSALGLDWRVLGFTLLLSMGTGILFGLMPAWSASRADLNSTLKESGSRSGTGFRQGKVRSLLIITEVALALVLLVGSALLIRTLIALRGVDPGFNASNVLTMEMSLNGERFRTTAGVAQLLREGRDRLNTIPGVETAAAAYWLPNEVGDGLPFQIIGRPSDKEHQYGSRWMSVSPGYLSVFKIPVLRGRDFNESDTAASATVVMINQALAEKYWPGEDPIGRQIVISKGLGPQLNESRPTVVGIVADSHNAGLDRPAGPMVMMPIAQVTDAYTISYSDVQPLLWVVRTHADPRALIPAVTEQLRIASHGFPVAHLRTMDEIMGRSTPHESFNMLLLSIFGFVALVLAAIGIYGVMAYSVAQRTQEMGIRMALGADRTRIRRLVIWQGMRLASIGVLLGLGAALGLTRAIASLLFGVLPWDPAAFVSAPLILSAVALLAVWMPALRASGVEPMEALRTE